MPIVKNKKTPRSDVFLSEPIGGVVDRRRWDARSPLGMPRDLVGGCWRGPLLLDGHDLVHRGVFAVDPEARWLAAGRLQTDDEALRNRLIQEGGVVKGIEAAEDGAVRQIAEFEARRFPKPADEAPDSDREAGIRVRRVGLASPLRRDPLHLEAVGAVVFRIVDRPRR